MKKNIKTKSKNYKVSYKWSAIDRNWSYPASISASNIFEAISNLCDSRRPLGRNRSSHRIKSAHKTSNQNGNQYWRVHFYPESPEKEFGGILHFKVTPLNEDYLTKDTNVYF